MEKQNIYQKLNKLKEELGDGFNKDKKGYNYSYVTISQIFAKINPIMINLGIVVIPDVSCETIKTGWHTYKTKNGETTDAIIEGYVSFKWINVDDKEDFFITKMPLLGQQNDIAQAAGTALTYAERYMYLKVLGVQTDADDPDLKNHNQANPKLSNDGVLSEAQIKRLYAIAKSKGRSKEQVIKVMEKEFGKSSIGDLTRVEYDSICNRLEALEIKKDG